MNVYDFFTIGYESLHNRKYIPMRVLSPFRYIFRNIANCVLPIVLERHVEFQGITASSWLLKKGHNHQLIVSMTSFPKRIANVWKVVKCLKSQSVIPDSIILYVSKSQFASINALPKSLLEQQDEIFKIEFVDGDIRSHKKYYYSFQRYKDELVLLVDDDIYYPRNMIESMLNAFVDHPASVICRFGYQMKYDKCGNLLDYKKWSLFQKPCMDGSVFFGTGGGSLFIPANLYKDTCNIELALKLCPLADDVWINAMVRLAGVKIVKLSGSLLLPIFAKDDSLLCHDNVIKGENDIQIKAVDDYYYRRIEKKVFNKSIKL